MADLSIQPKEKRRNSEKRKEKSRDAARCRRSKESEIFADLALSLPLPSSVSSQLDKASIMRLTIAYLQARTLMSNSVDDKDSESLIGGNICSLDSLVPRMLDGFLIILSAVGDIIYVTESVNYHLGLTQFDVIGQSIYDFSHPCDHNEMREALDHHPDGSDTRSFFARFKCTLTTKGRSVNLKSASYKVVHCNGRMMSARGSFSDDEDLANDQTNDFLVLVGEPLPYPTNIEEPQAKETFVTKHAMDLKYIYVDEKIEGFLGYSPEELEGKSAYDFHHILDNDVVLRNYKTLLAKGQSQTSSYRFLARNGGYVWLQTQATVVYGNRDSRPQAIICVHYVLSEIEEPDQVLSLGQALASAETVEEKKTGLHLRRAAKMDSGLPEFSTAKLFAPRTADMSKGFLTFNDKEDGITVFKEEPEDLTHLAPIAGDACIPLELSGSLIPLNDLLDDISLPPGILDCFPLTGFEFAAENDFGSKTAAPCPPPEEDDDVDNAVSVTSSIFGNKDPFAYPGSEDLAKSEPGPGTSTVSDTDIFSSLPGKSSDNYGDYMRDMELETPLETEMSFSPLNLNYPSDLNMGRSPASDCGSALSTLSSLNNDNASSDADDFSLYKSVGLRTIEQLENCPALSRQHSLQVTSDFMSDEEDLEMRAPFIPMGDSDDLPLFSCEDTIFDAKMDDVFFGCNPLMNRDVQLAAESNLGHLLRTTSVDCTTESVWQQKKPLALKECPTLVRKHSVVKDTFDVRGLKRAFSCPADAGQIKRPKGSRLMSPLHYEYAGGSEPKLNKVAKSKMNGGGILLENPTLAKQDCRIEEQLPTFKAKLPTSPQRQQQAAKGQQSSSVLLNLLAKPRSAKEQLQQQLKARRPVVSKESNPVLPLLGLTSHDCEVNAPLQSISGLLQGDDLLSALDLPSEFVTVG